MSEDVFHVRAVPLPDGGDPIDIWVSRGKLAFEPIPAAVTLPGRYVALGMVDAHVHLSLDFANSNLAPASADLVLHNAQRHLRAGVTAVRDAGYVRQLELDSVSLPPMPIIQRSGWIHVPEGRFFPGLDIGKSTNPGTLVNRVHEIAAAGLPWFKVIADFPTEDADLFAAPLNYPIEELAEAVSAAHRHGIRVMAHSTGPSIDDIIRAGVDAIEHGMSATVRSVELMAEHGIHWTPTIGTAIEFLKGAEQANGAPADPRLRYSERLAECLPLALEIGVPVLVGSDELPHGSIAAEMKYMVDHGLSTVDVIRAATELGRKILRLGEFAEGAPADLVLFDEDPRQNLDAIGKPTAVIAAGKRVDIETPLDAPGTDVPVRVRLAESPHADCVFHA